MSANFIQLHFLTAYGANVLNRDELNRPKSMVYGTSPRLRVSSQAVKRAWRLSEVLEDLEKGTRTRNFWVSLANEAIAAGHKEADVLAHIYPLREALEGKKAASASTSTEGKDTPAEDAPAEAAATEEKAASTGKKGSGKGGKSAKAKGRTYESVAALGKSSNLFFYTNAEMQALRDALSKSLGEVGSTGAPMDEAEAQKVLAGEMLLSADVAMFGRMVADNKKFSVEGGIQVAHAFTTNKMTIDEDYLTAVDDLNLDADKTQGSAHLATVPFGSGLYYSYVNIDVRTLLKNLKNDIELAKRLVSAFIEACATVSPSAKQNTFAARSYATYFCVETGNAQPRSYADAYLNPVKSEDVAGVSIDRLKQAREMLNKAFPAQAFQYVELNRLTGEGSLPELQAAACNALV